METDLWVPLAIALPFIGAAVTPALTRLLGERVAYIGASIALASFGLVASQIGTQTTVTRQWIPSLDVAFRLQIDAWSVLFGLLASGIGVLIFLYSARYMHGESNLGRFYMALLAFMGSILGVAFAGDLVLLFLFWELTSVCSFVLIGYHTGDNEARYAARMAMVVTVGGGICLLVGLLVVGVGAQAVGLGAFDLTGILENPDSVATALEERGLFVPALALVTVAAGAKSAQVPLYFWLPRAMVAPTPVSAFLHSATMVKVGVYALGRVRPLFVGPEWLVGVATLGLVTMAVGALLAVVATDIKELLAYSTASHLGLMVAGFGFQQHYGPEAGAFHLLNHALFKAALFLVAGIVAHEVGTRNIDKLGGLWRDLPVTAAITVVAGLSMAGVPPFNGFYSKELLFEAAWETAVEMGGLAWLFPALAAGASIFTVLYSLRFLWLFFGGRADTLGEVHRPPALLLAPPAVLAVVAVVVSLVPSLAIDTIVNEAAAITATEPIDMHAPLPTKVSGPVLMSATSLVGGVTGFRYERQVRTGIERFTQTLTAIHPTSVYDRTLTTVDKTSRTLRETVQTGMVRTYVWWLLCTACALTLAAFVTAGVGVPAPEVGATPTAMAVVLTVAIVAATAVTTTDTHVTGVLTLGILGFMVAIFYILASGADLALTQLVVETLLLLIFLLVLEQLPVFYGELDLSRAIADGVVSLFVGATVFVAVLVATDARPDGLSRTASRYVNSAVKEGGGSNVVNVILTDFRALDTLGESIVVLTAALSVFVLITMRLRGETQ